MHEDVLTTYGNRLRVRACGICWRGDSLLLVNHRWKDNLAFWAPPGGGVEFEQPLEVALKREVLEETGLEVDVKEFLFLAEFINKPLHALEVFFRMEESGGSLKTGIDPEMSAEKQIIQRAEFLSWEQLRAIPDVEKHGVLARCKTLKELRQLSGFFRL